jgi:prefoldin subunit 5
MENAQQLIATADNVSNEAIGVNTAAAESLDITTQALERVKEIVESTSALAANLLGEGHTATQSVTGSASVVVAKIEELTGQAQALRENITALDALILAHGDSMRTAGQQAMGGS